MLYVLLSCSEVISEKCEWSTVVHEWSVRAQALVLRADGQYTSGLIILEVQALY